MSVELGEALLVLFPAAVPNRDYLVVRTEGVSRLAKWSLAAPEPSAEQLASVTQEQVSAAYAARKAAENPEREELRSNAQQAIADGQAAIANNDQYLSVAGSATSLQVRVQVEALTRQNSRIIATLAKLIRRLTQLD